METSNLNIKIPVDLHRRLKSVCAERGETMTDVLLDCAKKYVEKAKSQNWPDRTADSRAPYTASSPPPDGDTGE